MRHEPQVITAVITTFERPDMCLRLIESARRYCPDVRLLVVDDSDKPREWVEADDWIHLPYDSGLSAKRNAGIAKVGSGWVVIFDDDFVCTEKTDLRRLVSIAENSGFDIVGGEVMESGSAVRYHGFFQQTGNHVVMQRGWTDEGDVHRCELIPNFFAARAETLIAHPWDERLKLAEHSAFFWKWRSSLKVGFTTTVAVDHRQYRPEHYQELRMRAAGMFKEWLNEQQLWWTDLHGTTLRCKDPNDD
jgi:glycosyltransferase involved in cell wall biosynthesis